MEQYRIQAASADELVRSVEAGVASGTLRPGQQLPSVRRLAAEGGLSPGTVAAGIPADSLCAVSGALDGIERVIQAHLRPGDFVAVENPGYAALFDLLRAHGLSLRGVALDERGMRPAELRAALASGARAAIITPRGQNPTGAELDATRARELRAVLAEA